MWQNLLWFPAQRCQWHRGVSIAFFLNNENCWEISLTSTKIILSPWILGPKELESWQHKWAQIFCNCNWTKVLWKLQKTFLILRCNWHRWVRFLGISDTAEFAHAISLQNQNYVRKYFSICTRGAHAGCHHEKGGYKISWQCPFQSKIKLNAVVIFFYFFIIILAIIKNNQIVYNEWCSSVHSRTKYD